MPHRIEIADKAGFCFGVDRAVKIVYNIIENGGKAVTYGEIIHNETVVNELKSRGVNVINSPEEIEKLENTSVVIRSHGVGRDIYELLEKRKPFGVTVCDGTCPFVARIHKIVSEKSAEGFDIIILGDKGHDEVQGIVKHCQKTPYICGNDAELREILQKKFKNFKKKVAIVAQTTYNIIIWEKCCRIIRSEYPEAEVFNTICSATAERQQSAVRLAEKSDLMIVIGGKRSSNTAKLCDIDRKSVV